MRESCFCGWSGDVADKAPAYLGTDRWGLTCPGCGRADDLTWLPHGAAGATLAEAARRHEQRRRVGRPAAAAVPAALERRR